MKKKFDCSQMEDPERLARLGFFSEQNYRDLLSYQQGRLTEEDFKSRYCKTSAILCLDMTD